MALPDATIYVYDNGSVDQTVPRALEAGAVVVSNRLLGKGMWCCACSPTLTLTFM